MTTQKHILIIEDEPAIREILGVILGKAGYQVTEALDAEAGKAKALAEHPDLILLDIIMPRIDGLTMLKDLRTTGDWGKTVPVIILSSLDDAGSVEEAKNNQAVGYIVKTNLTSDVILPKIAEVLA